MTLKQFLYDEYDEYKLYNVYIGILGDDKCGEYFDIKISEEFKDAAEELKKFENDEIINLYNEPTIESGKEAIAGFLDKDGDIKPYRLIKYKEFNIQVFKQIGDVQIGLRYYFRAPINNK